MRIDALWLRAQPQDTRAGADRLLTLGQAQAHHGYVFANAPATWVKLLVPDGFGVWCAVRRLHAGRFADTTCPNEDCGQPLQRVGQDVSEKLDLIPARLFVHRHIYGKWACRRCQQLVRRHPGQRAGGAHVDQPLCRPPALLPPRGHQRACRRTHAALDAGGLGRGKIKKAYVWAYARGAFDAHPGVIYDFCAGRGAQLPIAFLGSQAPPCAQSPWRDTLVCDQYAGYGPPGARSPGPARAPCGRLCCSRPAQVRGADHGHGHARQRLSQPLWDELRAWLQLERQRVAAGAIAQAIDYTLNHWPALTRHLHDGAVPIDNNHLEQQIKPWKLGAKNRLFVGSELAGQRAAGVMSLVQSAKLNQIDPWAYLRDVLARLHSHPASRIDELLPHRWRPN
jgi:hypothetical protein